MKSMVDERILLCGARETCARDYETTSFSFHFLKAEQNLLYNHLPINMLVLKMFSL